jgi:hypothetical protein
VLSFKGNNGYTNVVHRYIVHTLLILAGLYNEFETSICFWIVAASQLTALQACVSQTIEKKTLKIVSPFCIQFCETKYLKREIS